MARGQDGGYLYSRDGKLIPIDETHHEYVAKHPKLFFSDDEIATLCRNYKVPELRALCHDEDFMEETGPIFEHFSKCLTKKGWLKVRNIGLTSQTYITCYMFKRDYDTVMNLLTKVPDIINDNLHIEGVVDEDWISTDKSSAEKDLLERMCEAIEAEERIQENRFNGEPWFSNPTAEEIEADAKEWRKNHPEPTYFIGVVVEEDGSKYFVDKYNDLTDNYYLAKLFNTKEEAEETASVARVCPSIVQSLEVYGNYKLKESASNGFLACCYDPEDFYEETNYVDKDGELNGNSSGCEVFATEDEAIEWADDNKPYGWNSFAMPAGCGPSLKEGIEDVPKITYKTIEDALYQWYMDQLDFCSSYGMKEMKWEYDQLFDIIKASSKPSFGLVNEIAKKIEDRGYDADVFKKCIYNSIKESKESFFDKLLEDIKDFPQSTHQMYRFARRRHNDTGAVRKVSGQPYWVHPEGVALIVMKHGGSDLEIKAAMAHDVLEDTGESFEDMVEKFGYEVASIVNEITNDKDEIKKVGKEQYISDELCRISDEALTVKLADMLYNQKDSPTESNYIRMRNNVNYMLNNREDLLPIHKELAQEILDV